jgi:hypothetical protein
MGPDSDIGEVRNKEDDMDTHFFFGLTVVLFVFLLCFWFRKENKGGD